MGHIKSTILMGIKHSGKSALGRLLAEKYGSEFTDLDDVIRMVYTDPAISIREIYRRVGKEGFMDLEVEAARRIADSIGSVSQPRVVALGGGTIENRKAMQVLKPIGPLVYLQEAEEILFKRVIKKGIPPFLSESDPESGFHTLYQKRHPLYLQAADLVVLKNGTSVPQAFETLVKALQEAGYAG